MFKAPKYGKSQHPYITLIEALKYKNHKIPRSKCLKCQNMENPNIPTSQHPNIPSSLLTVKTNQKKIRLQLWSQTLVIPTKTRGKFFWTLPSDLPFMVNQDGFVMILSPNEGLVYARINKINKLRLICTNLSSNPMDTKIQPRTHEK